MLNVRLNSPRLPTRFHASEVTHLLPEFMEQEYPMLVKFLEEYYKHSGESNVGSFEHQIKTLFDIRDITSTTLEALDLILEEVGNGLQHTAFAQNPRIMVKLISDFYRAKGSQISAEQFFKSFFAEDVEISFPKRDLFILNSSKIGPESLKFITDGKKYQVFSVLIKTGLSTLDYEALYRKFVHPAGFYLATEVALQSEADCLVSAGDPIDPLEPANYGIGMGDNADEDVSAGFALLTMRSSNPPDADIVISSIPLVSTYQEQSFEDLGDEGFETLGDLVSLNSPATIDGIAQANSDIQTIDTDEYN